MEEIKSEKENKQTKTESSPPAPKTPNSVISPSPEEVKGDDNPEELIRQYEKSGCYPKEHLKNTLTSVIINSGVGSSSSGVGVAVEDKQSIDKSKGKIRRKCIICTEKLEQEDNSDLSADRKPPRPPKSAEEAAQEELAVVFFLQKFLEHPLIPEQSLEDLLTHSKLRKRIERGAAGEGPTPEYLGRSFFEENFDWIWFCHTCLQHVQEARELCMQIIYLQEKFNELRDEVLDKVVSTIIKESRKAKGKNEEIGGGRSGDKEEEQGRVSHLYSNVRHLIYQKKTGLVFQAEQNEMCASSFVEAKVKAECSSDSWDDQLEEPMTPAWHNQGLVNEDGIRIPATNVIGFGMPTGDTPPRRHQLDVQPVQPVQPSTTLRRRKRYTNKHSYTMTISKNYIPKRKRERPTKNHLSPQPILQDFDESSLLQNEEVFKDEEETTRTRSTLRRASRRRGNYRDSGNSDAEEMFFKLDLMNEDNNSNALNEEIGRGSGSGGVGGGPSDEEQEEKPKQKERGRPKKLDGPKKYVKKKKFGRENNDSMDRLLHRRDNRGRGKCSVESRTCHVCQRVFIKPSQMLVHLNMKHERKILFHCDVCNRGFLRKDYVMEHKKVHLSPEEKMLEKARRECGIRKKKVRKIGIAEGCKGASTSTSDSKHIID